MAKLIYSPSLAAFQTAYPNHEKEENNDAYRSIALMADGHMYTHGKTFKLALNGSSSLSDFSINTSAPYKISITVDGTSKSVTLPSITNTDESLVIDGYDIGHKELIANYTGFSPVEVDNYILHTSQLKFNKFGHITEVVEVSKTDHLDYVRTALAAEGTNYYITGTSSSTGTVGTLGMRSTHYFKGSDIYENGTKLSAKYFLQSNVDTTLSTSTTKVPTSKVVKDYVDSMLSANDAMVFKGTIGASADSPTVTALPYSGYSAGWTYRVITAGTYFGSEKCEVGDLIIAVADGPTSGSSITAAHWTAVQTNIDGAVTTTADLSNKLVYGNGSKTLAGVTLSGLTLTSGTLKVNTATASALGVVKGGTTSGKNYGVTIATDGSMTVLVPWEDHTYAIATTTVAGLVKPKKVLTSAPTTNEASETAGKWYQVDMDSTGAMYVNVPWSNSTYTLIASTSTGTTNAVSTDPYIHLKNSSTKVQLKGGTNISIASDASGVITVNGPSSLKNPNALTFSGVSSTNTATSTTYDGSAVRTIAFGGGMTCSISGTTMTIADSWRDIKAYTTANMTTAASLGNNTLTFGTSFANNSNTIDIVWAEIDADGAITYAV